MIRQPSSNLYAWHRAAIAGRHPVITNEPQCGWFKRKLVKSGVMVPARIWMFQPVDPVTNELTDDEVLQCEINGAFADPVDAWSWLCGNPITEQEFHYLTARIAHAAIHDQTDAFATPRAAVDLMTMPALF